jgi:hypothetical protein
MSNRSKVFEIRVVKKVFGSKREDRRGEWRRLQILLG